MAFLRKAGDILGRIASTNANQEISFSKPSILQALRCMSTKVFVGGLSYSTDDTSLREAFDKYGEVAEARVIVDRETGRSRGFGFVTYSSTEEASAAIQALDQQDLHGRVVRVNFANERARGGFGGGGGGYGGGGGGYGGGNSYGSYGGGGSNYNSGGGGYGNEAAADSYPAAGGESNTGGGFGGGSFGYGGEGQNPGVAGGVGGATNFSDDTTDSYADRRG